MDPQSISQPEGRPLKFNLSPIIPPPLSFVFVFLLVLFIAVEIRANYYNDYEPPNEISQLIDSIYFPFASPYVIVSLAVDSAGSFYVLLVDVTDGARVFEFNSSFHWIRTIGESATG